MSNDTSKEQVIGDELAKKFQVLLQESDRGCVLLAVTRLDEALENLHKTKIGKTAARPNRLIAALFRPTGPLSSFWSRIAFAYAYGLISLEDYRDLELIREIRNRAAHSSDSFNFEDAKLTPAILKMDSAKRISAAIPAIGWRLTSEVEQLLSRPDKNTVKLFFLLTCMSLEISVVSQIVQLLGGDLPTKLRTEREKGNWP